MRHRRVRAVMTSAVLSVHPWTGFKDIAALLSTHHISALPVIDNDRRVLGVVSEADLVAKYDYPSADPLPWSARRRAWLKAMATTAENLMTGPAITVTADTNIVRAARLMAEHQVKRLPVVDADRRLVGIISRRDLVRVFVRSDDEIAAEIREDILSRALKVNPTAVEVDMREGVVTLRGHVERHSMVPVALALCRRIDGVVDARADLTFALDDLTVDDAVVPHTVGLR